MMNETLPGDDDLISFEGSNHTLFAAAMLLAANGKAISYEESLQDNLLETGAELALAKLRSGEWHATGINPETRVREEIAVKYWESARYDPPLFTACHYVEFVEREEGEIYSGPVGLGGALRLYDGTKRWFGIRVAIPAALAMTPEPELAASVADVVSPRRGRPLKYDWPAFLAAAQDELDNRGDFKPADEIGWDQAALEKFMLDWCEQKRWSQLPSESTIRARVAQARKAFMKARGQ